MLRGVIALTLLAATTRAAAAQTPDLHLVRYRASPWVAASVAAGGVLALIPDAAGLPTGPAPCGPCDPRSVPSIDRAALHNASDGATTASSVLLLGVAGFSGLASLAFAAATTYLMIAERERLPHRTRNAILLYAGALGVAALRVAAGTHFPTDVAAGAALGTGIGWLAAHVHPTVP